MSLYYLIFSLIALLAITNSQRRVHPVTWVIVFGIMLVFVGLRHHVGMDWNNYLFMIQRVNLGSWIDALRAAEPAYASLLWISGQLGWGVYGANVVGTFIFLWGLFSYARRTPHPWIAIVVAFPYLVIVISMSGARQAVAVGVILWLISRWQNTSSLHRGLIVLWASAFHSSAILFLLPVISGLQIRGFIKGPIALVLLAISAYFVLRLEAFVFYQQNYFDGIGESALSAGGGFFHVALNAGPAALALVMGQRVRSILLPDKLHLYMAYGALLLVPLVSVSSIGASRVSIYLFPVSMMVISSLPTLMRLPQGQTIARGGVTMLSFLVLFVWLNFANNSLAWSDYSNLLSANPDDLVLCCR